MTSRQTSGSRFPKRPDEVWQAAARARTPEKSLPSAETVPSTASDAVMADSPHAARAWVTALVAAHAPLDDARAEE